MIAHLWHFLWPEYAQLIQWNGFWEGARDSGRDVIFFGEPGEYIWGDSAKSLVEVWLKVTEVELGRWKQSRIDGARAITFYMIPPRIVNTRITGIRILHPDHWEGTGLIADVDVIAPVVVETTPADACLKLLGCKWAAGDE